MASGKQKTVLKVNATYVAATPEMKRKFPDAEEMVIIMPTRDEAMRGIGIEERSYIEGEVSDAEPEIQTDNLPEPPEPEENTSDDLSAGLFDDEPEDAGPVDLSEKAVDI